MNRSIWIIAGLGLFAAVAMSMVMERALQVHGTRSSGPVALAVNRNFGARLAAPATFRSETEGGKRVGRLALRPIPGISLRPLVADSGATAWRELGRDGLDTLIVSCAVEDAGAVVSRFAVPAPWNLSASIRELPAETMCEPEGGVSPAAPSAPLVPAASR